MITLKLDWNCIIALENGEVDGKYVARLIDAFEGGLLDVAVTSVSAAENMPREVWETKRYETFEKRLAKVGLSARKAVAAPAVIGRSFIGSSVIQSVEDVELYEKIRKIVAPQLDRSGALMSEKKRTNLFCDASTLHAHMLSGRDVFVTNNVRDFQRKIGELKALGVKEILTPKEAVEKYLSEN
ncbi:hypothetical protein NBRC116590_06930 [Pelagimonas sp. KU-00592-HH]|uniref:hypothetical protein n=1 Tax=Pelagimonas sp. KU-00592-HH TaxID=3127651 RepID=UPI003105BEFB